jgi:hypothetical protein
MRKTTVLIPAAALGAALAIGATLHVGEASDHDDPGLQQRALNLTDHFAFKSPAAPTDLSLIMYFNPKGLPGKQYFLATNARYEFHVSKVADKLAAPSVKDDYVFRFEAKAPDAAGIQEITLTALRDGMEIGRHTGMSTPFERSKGPAEITTNIGDAGGLSVRWFVGQRADSFHFDVNRFFQVRSFLANRFFGGPGGIGNAGATLAKNCRGDDFGAAVGLGSEGPGGADADGVNLFNPPSCAPDFTKNLNVTSIALNVKIDQLGGKVFDTWSTISVAE